MGQSSHLSALGGRLVQCFWEKYSIKALYLKSVWHEQFFSMGGGSAYVVSMMDFLMGGVDQRTFGPCTAAPLLTNQTVSSPEKLSECSAGVPQRVVYKVKQYSKPCCTV